MLRFIERALHGLVRLQITRPLLVLFLAACTAVPAGALARKLELRTGFSELLPEDMPSVLELRRVSARLPSASTLAITAESKNTALLERFVDELVPKIRAFPGDVVSSVEDGPREAEKFFKAHEYLYAPLEDLTTLHDQVLARYDWEVSKKMGTALDEDEEPPRVTAESIKKLFQKSLDDAKSSSPGSDGYYLGEDGHLIVILVRTSLHSMDLKAFDLEQKITELIEAGDYRKVDPEFRSGFTGNLVTSAEEYRSVMRDLTSVGAAGIFLVLLVVFLFFWRFRALVSMGVAISLGCLWSFAFAELSVGHLNTATGFLVSVIAGNGINAMVIYMARFIEARRDQRMDLADAVKTATFDTYGATFAAVGVAMVSMYGALMTTTFRGFRHFGIIGAAGMFLCWVSTYSVLPACLVLYDRRRPLSSELTLRDRLSGLYARPFVWLARRYPGPIALLGLASAVLGTLGTYRYFAGDPMEYDMKKVRNEAVDGSSARSLSSRIGPIIGRLNQGGRAMLVDRLDQVDPLVKELERRRNSVPKERKPFGKVVSVYSMMPSDQDRKIELLTEMMDRMRRAHKRGSVSEADYAEIRSHVPDELKKLELTDLPDLVAAPFREKDGSVGKIVYVAPAPGRSVNDAHYLILWADAFREVKLPTGEIIRGTGDAVVFSDMLLSIVRDAPRVAGLSALGTAMVIILAFRGRKSGWVALATLCLGLVWLVGGLDGLGVKLNFLNFVALPIAIGVGSDYAINVMKRREIEGDDGIERAFTETGGAVVACSMTTLSGYAALLFSINGAVRSMGITAGLGELATQFSAMLILPAVLYWVGKRRKGSPAAAKA